jgi:hypothetical protein
VTINSIEVETPEKDEKTDLGAMRHDCTIGF